MVDKYFAKIGNKDLAEYFATWSAYRIRPVHAKLTEFNAIYRPTWALQGITGARDICVFVRVNTPRLNASTSTRLGRNAEIPDVVKKDWSLARAVQKGVVEGTGLTVKMARDTPKMLPFISEQMRRLSPDGRTGGEVRQSAFHQSTVGAPRAHSAQKGGSFPKVQPAARRVVQIAETGRSPWV